MLYETWPGILCQLRLQPTVTIEKFLQFGVAGRLPNARNSGVGNPLRDGYEGKTTPYKIENGKVVTTISQDSFAVTSYKLDDRYYGARRNGFDYEIIATPQFVSQCGGITGLIVPSAQLRC